MKALTQDELKRLLDGTEDLRLHTIILLGFRHGMRVSELCGLQWTDIDLNARTIVVRRLKHSLRTTQPLNDEEHAALVELKRTNVASEYVFPSTRTREDGGAGQVNRTTVYRWFQEACLLTEIDKSKAHPHALKHALGLALARANVTMPVIKQALGHRSINSTAVYTQMDDETVGKIVQEALQ